MITGTTKLLGVIGYPVEHSFSPVMHNAAIAHLGLDYAYLPFPVHPHDLHQAIAGFAAIGVQGLSVTIPHKQAVMPLLSEISAIAQAVGAVNTLYRTAQGWSGTNTDVEGFLAPLKALSVDGSQKTAVILGNGGAARAVVVGCTQLGFANIQVVGRDLQKLQQFQSSLISSMRSLPALPEGLSLSVHHWQSLPALLPQADLLVNTTPIGMYPQIDQSPLAIAEMDRLAVGTLVYDLIYTPNPTQLLQQAQGAIAIDGLEMLVQQGATAFQLWLQQPAPIEVMRRSLKQQLGIAMSHIS
jgi:shikimate dehydrogenase